MRSVRKRDPRPVAALVRPAAPTVIVREWLQVVFAGGGGSPVASEGVAVNSHSLAGQRGAQLLVADIA